MSAHEQIRFRALCRQLRAGEIDAAAFSAATEQLGPTAWSLGQMIAAKLDQRPAS